MSSSTTKLSLTHWRRPMLWMTAIIAIAAYWDPEALRGPFVYDDVASINNNVVVKAEVPWTEAFTRDFWGTPMSEPQSHKSYRPITSLTLRINWIYAILSGAAESGEGTYGFHAFNIILHGINTGLVTETAAIVFADGSLGPAMIAGIIFGIHPVHAEAVSNITSRGELLMTFFFLLAFLSYASHVPKNNNNQAAAIMKGSKAKQPKQQTVSSPERSSAPPKKGKKGVHSTKEGKTAKQQPVDVVERFRLVVFVYFFPCFFMALSLFSKEQGATTLCTLVAFDFLQHHSSILQFVSKIKHGDSYSWEFLIRTGILAIQTLVLIWIRWMLNGATSPDFVYEQNPAGFTEDASGRIFTVNWVYCLYLRDMAFPIYLAPDWSGNGIDIVESISDQRAWFVILLWLVAAVSLYSLFVGVSPKANQQTQETRRIYLTASIAFLFLPFLLSSNLLVTTGLMKADRVIYLPLFGFCLAEGLVYKLVYDNTSGEDVGRLLTYVFLLLQFVLFGLKVHERNLAWSNEYILWTRAYQVNPKSFHTISNAGRMLSKNQEWAKAEEVLRPIQNVRTNNFAPNDTFLYAVALSNLGRCNEAHPLINDAIAYVHEEREKRDLRYSDEMSYHTETSLIVARAFCTDDIFEKGRIILQATQMHPANSFAQFQLTSYMMKMYSIHGQMQAQLQEQQDQMPEGQKQQIQQQLTMAQEHIQNMQQDMSHEQKTGLQQQMAQLQAQASQQQRGMMQGQQGQPMMRQQGAMFQGDGPPSIQQQATMTQAQREEMQRKIMMQQQQQAMMQQQQQQQQQQQAMMMKQQQQGMPQQGLPDLEGIEDMFFN